LSVRNLFLVAPVALTLLPASASAQQAREQKQGRPAASLPLRAKAINPCAEYGPGFVRVEGSSTCIKIGGNFGVGVGVSR
jgi:hypothetical protein